MNWKVGVTSSFVAASLLLCGRVAVAADAASAPAAAKPTTDTLEAAVARVGDLSKRVAAIGEEAAVQRTQLEALRVRLVEDFREQAATLAAKSKELDEARGQVATMQKQIADLRAAVAARDAAPKPADLAKQVEAKDEEIAGLRAELRKLERTIADARTGKEKTAAAAPAVGRDASGIQTVAASAPPAEPATAAAAPPAPADPTSIKKWERPDGSLFFGERPPPGSKFLGYTTGGGL